MRFSGTKRTGLLTTPRLPLVALIDVVLFLLLYFMIASNFALDESQLSSALQSEGSGKGRGSNLLPQVLRVERGERGAVFTLGDRVMADKPSLVDLLSQLPKDNGVFVKVKGDVPVAAVATALQACKDAGFTKISYVPAK